MERATYDRVAVLYVARFIAKYWPGTEAASKDPKFASAALQLLRLENAPLIRNARIEARKMLSQS
ncbi:MAG: hypothetical protein I8H75_05075 [Myxococcaceae bacterium]|nr:hypothetical protein [Myxococcaceae bacterium]MBH2006697.1 hypothetical protein [Myxococcaceae bacterium]